MLAGLNFSIRNQLYCFSFSFILTTGKKMNNFVSIMQQKIMFKHIDLYLCIKTVKYSSCSATTVHETWSFLSVLKCLALWRLQPNSRNWEAKPWMGVVWSTFSTRIIKCVSFVKETFKEYFPAGPALAILTSQAWFQVAAFVHQISLQILIHAGTKLSIYVFDIVFSL